MPNFHTWREKVTPWSRRLPDRETWVAKHEQCLGPGRKKDVVVGEGKAPPRSRAVMATAHYPGVNVKKIIKKLQFSSELIRDLSIADLRVAVGGEINKTGYTTVTAGNTGSIAVNGCETQFCSPPSQDPGQSACGGP